jgi:hypothetical protein
MQYLEFLEKKDELVNLFAKLQASTDSFAEQNNQEIYTMFLLTHVTDDIPSTNYSTTMLMANSEDQAVVHTLVALVQSMEGSGLLELLKKIIHDKEQDMKEK